MRDFFKLKKRNKCLFIFLFIFLSNIVFAKGVVDICQSLYTDAHSEEWIRETILAHPNVKEIAKMTKLPDSSQHRIYLIMKDETKIILPDVKSYDKNRITCSLGRIEDYTNPRMLVYDTEEDKYYCGKTGAEYDNETFEKFVKTRDLSFLLSNYKEIKAYFASLPCLSEEDRNLLNERREKEIEVLQNVCWEKIKKNYTYYVVFKADDVSWGRWNIE